MYSIGFIGLIPNLVRSDVVLSFEISIAVNSVIKEKLNIIIPGVKFSSLYASFGILNCWNINNKNNGKTIAKIIFIIYNRIIN